MHDANHGSFSTSKRVNRWFGYTADLLGASSWLWRQQHNVAHHRYTNIAGLDGDIDQAPFARLEPGQQWRRHHRAQHWYMWVLYGFLVLKWVFVGDPTTLASRYRSPQRPTLREAAAVIAGKVLHGCFAFAIPLLFHPWQVVLVGYVVFTFLLGLLLAVTFQLAHCTDAVTFFPERPTTTGDAGAVHQLATTADFAPRGRVAAAYLGFCLGGLEYQVEHHLAPRLPHTAYRAMSAKVSAVCTERGLVHRQHRSPAAALASHYRHLRTLAIRPAC
jgi:linoleoyl-CoA desaturase